MQAPEKIAPQQPRRFEWDAEMLLKLDGASIFGEARIELIEGELYEMDSIGPRHAMTTVKIADTLQRYFSIGYVVSAQNPVRLSNRSVPQPDIAVLRGTYRDFLDTLPETAVLMVEVADSTLATDRRDKASLYARYSIPELWIADLSANRLEVYRAPIAMSDATHGYGYSQIQILDTAQSIAPLELGEISIAVADLLP